MMIVTVGSDLAKNLLAVQGIETTQQSGVGSTRFDAHQYRIRTNSYSEVG